MRKLISLLEENWEATLAFALLGIVIAYDAVQLFGGRPLKPEVLSHVIMLMLAAITLMLVRIRNRSDSENLDQLTSRLTVDCAGRNPFIKNWIIKQIEPLKFLARQSFGTTEFDVNQLVEAVAHAKRQDRIQAVDHGPGWQERFAPLQKANIKARKEGVAITRIFIIPRRIARDGALARDMWATMVEQAQNDITVKWVTQDQLKENSPELDLRDRGMALFCYHSTEFLLMLDAPNAHLVALEGGDSGFEVYWSNHDEVRKRQDDFRILDNLEILSELSKSVKFEDPIPFLCRAVASPLGQLKSEKEEQVLPVQ